MEDVIDAPVEEEVLDQPETSDQQPEESGEPDSSAEAKQPSDRIDGRKFNPEWSKALKEMRELYPDRADMLTKLRDTYGRYQALSEIAPKGLDDVRGWKTTLDAIGGPEAAAQLMQRAAEIEQIDERIARADFSVVSELPEAMQKGFYGMLGEALSHLAGTDSQKFGQIVQPHFAAALKETGLGDHLRKMYAAAGDNEPLKEMIRQQYEWFQQQTSGSGQMRTGKTVDPEVQRLQQELERRQRADDDSFANGVAAQADQHLREAFDREMQPYKSLGLNEKQTADLMASVNARVAAELGADKAFQQQLAAFRSLKARDPQAVAEYVKAHVDARTKSVLDDIVSTRYSGAKTRSAAPAARAERNQEGPARVSKAPAQSEWDMEKMNELGYDATAKKGLYYLKGGRRVQLAR